MTDGIRFSEHSISDLSMSILALLRSPKPLERLITDIVLIVKRAVSIESIGLRLSEPPDFPYYFTQGFDADFVEKENTLCATDQLGELIRDSEGNPVLECMCGNVIAGRTDSGQPFFTEGGSYWSNCTSDLLASTTEEDRQSRTRNRCNGEGYESVALIPVKASGTTFGLLQLNDYRKNMFTEDLIGFLEGVSVNIALLFSMVKQRKEFEQRAFDVARLVTVRGELLERLAGELHKWHERKPTPGREDGILHRIDSLLSEIELLKGVIPICCSCKKVRTDPDYWIQVEAFVSAKSSATFTHTYCPECFETWKNETSNQLKTGTGTE